MGLYQKTKQQEERLAALESNIKNAGLDVEEIVKADPDALKERLAAARPLTATATQPATATKTETKPSATATPRRSILNTAKPKGRYSCTTVDGSGTESRKSWSPKEKPANRFSLVPA